MAQGLSGGTQKGIKGLERSGQAIAPHIRQSERDGDYCLFFQGAWDFIHADRAEKLVASFTEFQKEKSVTIELAEANSFDSAGAALVESLRRRLEDLGCKVTICGPQKPHLALIDAMSDPKVTTESAANHSRDGAAKEAKQQETGEFVLQRILAAIGARGYETWQFAQICLHIVGALTAACFTLPLRLLPISIAVHFQRSCIGAVPIVMLTSLLVGGIITQQGGFYLSRFSASIFVVDLSAVLILREIGLFLAAIIVAGRSGSAITAELGAMKIREEVEALQIIGFSPMDALILPRVIALILALPILCLLADIAALIGSCFIAWAYVDIPVMTFWARFVEVIDPSIIAVGLIKSPFMALIIAVVACAQGMSVGNSAESLGRHTTKSVVKSIFLVIVLDGVFAILFAFFDF